MKKEDKKLFTDALRSGEYKQTLSTLKDKNGMCCLGVACDVFKDRINGEWIDKGVVGFSFHVDGKKVADTALPLVLQSMLGMSSSGSIGKHYDGDDGERYDCLMGLNDSGVSFDKIADIIDENF